MPIAEALGAASALTTIGGSLAKGVAAIRKATTKRARGQALEDVQALVESFLSTALDLQAQLLKLQTESAELARQNAELAEENAQLAAKLRAEDEWAKERQEYDAKVIGQSRVMVRKDAPSLAYCPTCFQRRKVVQIHAADPHESEHGTHICWGCRQFFRLR